LHILRQNLNLTFPRSYQNILTAICLFYHMLYDHVDKCVQQVFDFDCADGFSVALSYMCSPKHAWISIGFANYPLWCRVIYPIKDNKWVALIILVPKNTGTTLEEIQNDAFKNTRIYKEKTEFSWSNDYEKRVSCMARTECKDLCWNV